MAEGEWEAEEEGSRFLRWQEPGKIQNTLQHYVIFCISRKSANLISSPTVFCSWIEHDPVHVALRVHFLDFWLKSTYNCRFWTVIH